MPTANRLRWGDGNSGSSTDGGYTWALGTWTHITLTQDLATSRLYVNGEETASMSTSSYNFRLKNRIYVANYQSQGGNSNNHYARGAMDELVVFDRPLEATQVKKMYSAQSFGDSIFAF